MKWNHVAELELRGRRLAIKDAMILVDPASESPEWPFVEVEPGLYAFEIHVPETWHCARLRVVPSGTDPTLGPKLGDLDVDHAKAAVIDYDAFLATAASDFDSYEEWTGTELDDELSLNFSGCIDFGPTSLAYVTSGAGDGTYPVFELLEGEKVVGIECHFD